MCVAVVVEKDPPTADEWDQMEDSNPHGAGVAWCEDGAIHYQKGLTAKQIAAMASKLPTPWLAHFRWATHGSKAPRLAHPFPVGPRALTDRRLKATAEAVLIHNGTWSGYTKWLPRKCRRWDLSDTAVAAFAAGYDESVLDDVNWATALMRAGGEGRVDITMRGTWTEHNGNWFSNMNWRWTYSRQSWNDGDWDYQSWSNYGGWKDTTPTRAPRYNDMITCVSCNKEWYVYHDCDVSKTVSTRNTIDGKEKIWTRSAGSLFTPSESKEMFHFGPNERDEVDCHLSGETIDRVEPCEECGGKYSHYYTCTHFDNPEPA